MLISHFFFIVISQSTTLLFKRWWLSLIYLIGYTAITQWLFQESSDGLALQVWVYRFFPALLVWFCCSVGIERVFQGKHAYPPIIGEKIHPSITLWAMVESVAVHAAMLPAILISSVHSILFSAFFMFVYWVIYSLSHMTTLWRFDSTCNAQRFYCFYYLPTLCATFLTMGVGVALTDEDEFSSSRFVVAMVTALVSSMCFACGIYLCEPKIKK